ncbi:SPOR domain-containing protein [Thiomicrospira sp. S5]|uniref:SPOR domain-containing protein n=1 Tax=Thiomicrospira sp. S5 TaxID=1803865 RepID=UPI000F8A149B|nr:SPOR domain-containing protein [Thiomicrospira sp. S5]AZR81977.1 hypothetical protein AYJ59_06570 [Thiomicrospira sp. S5]
MAQTISELEKERAELLKAIESQAQQMSSSRQSRDTHTSEHTLNDWLNAAEEVMPSTPKRPTSSNNTQAPKSKNKASFFGVVIMLSLLLTILGVVYIAYTSIHNELQKVLAVKEDSMREVTLLKESVAELQKSVATGGKSELFDQLQKRVTALENELAALKKQPVAAAETVESQTVTETVQSADTLAPNVVTTDILEQKLQEYTQGIDKKLEVILKHLHINPAEMEAGAQEQGAANVSIKEETIDEPSVAEPAQPKVKPLDLPVVRLVKKVQKPAEPTTEAPVKNYTADVKWLLEEPAFNYTLQLASMQERSSVEKMIREKGLDGAKIIPLERKGEAYYVLLTGSYASRTEADKAAKRYKQNFGISPWVRKIKDLSNKLD